MYKDVGGNLHDSYNAYLKEKAFKLSPWITVAHCATRVIEGGDPNNSTDRVAFIEKTPRIRIWPCPMDGYEDYKNWEHGPKGTDEYGADQNSRDWCDKELLKLGYVLQTEEEWNDPDFFDFEMDSKPPEKGGETLCGKLGRKHKMKRQGPMFTRCIYTGCDGCC